MRMFWPVPTWCRDGRECKLVFFWSSSHSASGRISDLDGGLEPIDRWELRGLGLRGLDY